MVTPHHANWKSSHAKMENVLLDIENVITSQTALMDQMNMHYVVSITMQIIVIVTNTH